MAIVQIIKKLQSEGVTVSCYVQRGAMSMAFIIFSSCSKRYALAESMLLWHSASAPIAQGRYKAADLRRLAQELDVLDEHMRLMIIEATGMTKETYEYGDTNNTAWTAQVLMSRVKAGFMTIIAGFSYE
jgi:ATP-dependent protease ClpP protease subunit